jgi:hypothetical protein
MDGGKLGVPVSGGELGDTSSSDNSWAGSMVGFMEKIGSWVQV